MNIEFILPAFAATLVLCFILYKMMMSMAKSKTERKI